MGQNCKLKCSDRIYCTLILYPNTSIDLMRQNPKLKGFDIISVPIGYIVLWSCIPSHQLTQTLLIGMGVHCYSRQCWHRCRHHLNVFTQLLVICMGVHCYNRWHINVLTQPFLIGMVWGSIVIADSVDTGADITWMCSLNY